MNYETIPSSICCQCERNKVKTPKHLQCESCYEIEGYVLRIDELEQENKSLKIALEDKTGVPANALTGMLNAQRKSLNKQIPGT